MPGADGRDGGPRGPRRAVEVGETLAEVDAPGLRGERRHLGEDRRPKAAHPFDELHGRSVTIRCCLPAALQRRHGNDLSCGSMYAPTVTAWCRDVVKTYATDRAAGAAISGITKDIPGGALTVVAGPSGLWQVDVPAPARLRRPADLGHRRGGGTLDRRREQPGAAPAAPPPPRLHLSRPHRQPRRVPLRARPAQAFGATAWTAHRTRTRSPRSSTGSGSRTGPTTNPASSPAASSSGSASRAPWSGGRHSSLPTNPPRSSTRTPPERVLDGVRVLCDEGSRVRRRVPRREGHRACRPLAAPRPRPDGRVVVRAPRGAGTVVIEGHDLHKSFQRGERDGAGAARRVDHGARRRDPRHLRCVRLGEVDAARGVVRLGGARLGHRGAPRRRGGRPAVERTRAGPADARAARGPHRRGEHPVGGRLGPRADRRSVAGRHARGA